MGQAMREGLSHYLSQRWLAQSPHIWGKLPSHGDYLCYRSTPAQALGWKTWLDTVWHLRPIYQSLPGVAPPTAKQQPPQAGWMNLEAPAGLPDLSAVPIAFVLPPGTLSFSPKHYVQGVMIPSEDKIGRACPFIVYQQISRSWLARTWNHADPQGLHAHAGHHLLYWWSRVAARIQGTDRDFAQCCQAIDAVWQLHAPGWRQLAGAASASLAQDQLQGALGPYRVRKDTDTAWGLKGVKQLPWRDWPQRALTSSVPQAAFWQQDMRGAYVNAGESLIELWGVQS